jgi:hypothetical protein
MQSFYYREESFEQKLLKTRARIFRGRIVCALFLRLATRRGLPVNSMGSATSGKSRNQQGPNGQRGKEGMGFRIALTPLAFLGRLIPGWGLSMLVFN